MDMEVYNAALSGSIHDIEKYLEKQQPKQLPLTPTGNSVLHLHVGAPIHRRPARLEFIRYLLGGHDNDNDNDNDWLVWHRNDDGETALHVASGFGQFKAVQLLVDQIQVQQRHELLLIRNKESDTALHMAVRNRHRLVVNCLLQSVVPVQDQVVVEYAANAAGETPQFLAVESRDMQLLDMVLSHTSSSRPQENVCLAAVMRGYPGMVKKVLQRFPVLLNAQDEKGQTPLHYAAGFSTDNLRILLFNYDCSAIAYTQDNKGRTAAHMAAQSNNVHGMKLLMDRFPAIYELGDHQHRNVVHYAAFLGWPESLKFLDQEDIRFFYLRNKRDQEGNTPLHLLARSLKDVPIPLVRAWVKSKLLHGSQQRVFNNEGLTAADIALSYNFHELEPDCQGFVNNLLEVVPRGGQNKPLLPDLEGQKLKIKEVTEWHKGLSNEMFQKMARDHAVVAALITTVSFAAGLAVPGGFDQTSGSKDEGTAILINKAAFQLFMVSDTIALTSSFMALLFCFIIALANLSIPISRLLFLAFIANYISMFTLMVAFIAGTSSILSPSKRLSSSVLRVACPFLSVCIVVLLVVFTEHLKKLKGFRRKMQHMHQ